jgi:hypothetical protein
MGLEYAVFKRRIVYVSKPTIITNTKARTNTKYFLNVFFLLKGRNEAIKNIKVTIAATKRTTTTAQSPV